MKTNTGTCPREARGKRVIVKLANGRICGTEPVGNALPNGWAADGKQGCDWRLRGFVFDIAEWEIAR